MNCHIVDHAASNVNIGLERGASNGCHQVATCTIMYCDVRSLSINKTRSNLFLVCACTFVGFLLGFQLFP